MLAPSVPCLRNFHPTTTFFFCEACFHHCADFSLYLFALSPLSLPSLSPLHASSTNPRCAFTPSAVSFLPFRFPIYPFRWLRFPLPSLSLPHFRDIKPWFSRFDPTACHNTMARLQRRRQPRSSSLSRHRLLALIEHRVADCWLTERGNILREDEILVLEFFFLFLVNLILKKYYTHIITIRFSLNFSSLYKLFIERGGYFL